MAALDLKSLVSRLNETCHRSLDEASRFTLSRRHYNVEIEHWLAKLLDVSGGDVELILRHYEIDEGRLRADLNRSLDRLSAGNARAPRLSPEIVETATQAWLLASIEQGQSRVRSGHLLWALLADETLFRRTREISGQFAQIQLESLKRDLLVITEGGIEATAAVAAAPGQAASGQAASPAMASAGTTALDQFTQDLTAKAREGKIDPILGRDAEIRQVIDILTRRRQNNPILTGEAGVGKTAVVEGFALRIAAGDVPASLKDVTLRTLDLGLLQAGAGIKGEFENRLKSVIEETKGSPKPIILFIDEAHTLIGAGGTAGQGDAANLLKPALARGELRTIAATTWAEYKKYFEKDAALTRRFQTVRIEEPSEPVAIAMVRGLVATLEAHHKVRILDEAVGEAVRLSARFIPSRQLPDKAVSLIDTACARVGMSQAAVPAAIEDLRRRTAIIDTELEILVREALAGAMNEPRQDELRTERAAAEHQLQALEVRWEREKQLTAGMAEARAALESGTADLAAQSSARDTLTALSAELHELQGEHPLIHPVVDGHAVAEIVESWTGIPAGRMRSDEIRTVLALKQRLESRVIGQPHALEAVAQAIQTSRAKLTDPRKPIGVFMMVGTSGVGKTETALALADLLYGGAQSMTTINMTEFKEEHKVSLLMGSPPGYIGYGEGGILTEAVRRRPYSVILLDEMEKAHPGVQDVFFQVFDKGTMKDGEGRDIDFKNCVIIMTSNTGTDLITKLFADPESAPDAAGLAEVLRPELLKVFKPAFLGRVSLVPYFPLTPDIIRRIVGMQLDRIRNRLWESYRATMSWSDDLVEEIAKRCTDSASGARNVENILARGLLPELSGLVLSRLADGELVSSVRIGIETSGVFSYGLR